MISLYLCSQFIIKLVICNQEVMGMELGFLREYTDDIIETTSTGINTTGLNHYLADIFEIETYGSWIHNKSIPKLTRKRPDYRNEYLRLLLEFDGLPHYTNPDIIKSDMESFKYYKSIGYNLIRVPYFIQLTPDVIYQLFSPYVEISLDKLCKYQCLNNKISFDIHNRNTPAYMCSLGVERCRYELQSFPGQYRLNIDYLKHNSSDIRSGYSEFISTDISRFTTLFIDI